MVFLVIQEKLFEEAKVRKPYEECNFCPLRESVLVPPSIPQGEVDILFVGEAPGATEAQQGTPFVGRSGQLLREALRETGLDQFVIGITNAVLCHPTDERGNNRTPLRIEIECCRRRLIDEILTTRPKVVVILGNVALRSLLRKNGINKFRGTDVWLQEPGCYVVCTLHPASILYNPDQKPLWIRELSRVRNLLVRKRQEVEYRVIRSLEEFSELLRVLQESSSFAFDIETNNILSPFDDRGEVTAISFSTAPGKAFCVPLYYRPPKYTKEEIASLLEVHKEELKRSGVRPTKRLLDAYRLELLHTRREETILKEEDLQVVVGELRKLFADREKTIIAHNGKFDIQWLWKKLNIPARVDFDTAVAHFILDENVEHGLKFLAMVYTDMGEYASKFLSEDYPFLAASEEEFFTYSCADADATYRLYEIFRSRLEEEGLMEVFQMVMGFQHVAAMLEYGGVTIDVVALRDLKERMRKELEAIAEEIRSRREIKRWEEIRKETFSPLSVHHVSDLFFNCLGLTPLKKTKKGKNSVDRATIEHLAGQHELAELILRYRRTHKILSSFLEKFEEYIMPDGKIHARFNVIGTKTGRLSSSEPNMQNIPEHCSQEIKRLIIPSYEDGYIVNFDYSQIELRVMASLAEDETMIQAFREGLDIHTRTAQLIFGKEEVSKEERSFAKKINFGIIYGMSAVGLAEQLGISIEEAQKFIDRYFQTYPGVARYIRRQKKLIRTHGYVESPLGRRRRIPKVFSGDSAIVGEAEREAINAPIQSAASDLTQISLCQIFRELRRSRLRARPILTVHDSIVLECHRDDLHEVVRLVKHIMENPPVDFMRVPIEVEVEYGKNYGDRVPYTFEREVGDA